MKTQVIGKNPPNLQETIEAIKLGEMVVNINDEAKISLNGLNVLRDDDKWDLQSALAQVLETKLAATVEEMNKRREPQSPLMSQLVNTITGEGQIPEQASGPPTLKQAMKYKPVHTVVGPTTSLLTVHTNNQWGNNKHSMTSIMACHLQETIGLATLIMDILAKPIISSMDTD